MTVTVRLFAWYADRVGRDRLELQLDDGSVVGDAVDSIRSMPGAEVIPDRPLVAVNLGYAKLATPLADGDEVALIPPVAGG